MKHERDKTAILDSMMGYATHKNISPTQYFKNIKRINNNKEIKALSKRQAALVEDISPASTWKPDV